MASNLLTTKLEYYDGKHRIIDKKSRENSQVALRMMPKDKYCEIRITTAKSTDIFVTNAVNVQEDRSGVEVVTAWIPNYKCMLAISGNSEVLNRIRAFFNALSDVGKENTPPGKAKPSKLSPDKTPTKGKRSFGIVARDLFHSGCTPEGKICQAGSRQGNGTTTKSPPEHRLMSEKAAAVSNTQSVFMSLITSAVESNAEHSSAAVAVLHQTSYPLTDIQNSVLDACLRGRNVFYTGGAGTGKSTLLTVLITRLAALHGVRSVFVAATTGLAACAVGGTTLHQFAGISSVLEQSGTAAAQKAQHERVVAQSCSKGYVLKRFREAKVLLVDEVSMLSPTLLEIVSSIAQRARGSKAPMGGLQVVFCGDFYQLPPVCQSSHGASGSSSSGSSSSGCSGSGDGAGKVVQSGVSAAGESSRFCFQSPLWDALIQDSFDLQQVYRQSGDGDFIAVLNAVRAGLFSEQCRQVLDACVGRTLDCGDGILPTQIFTHKREVDKLNNQKLAELTGTARVFLASDSGDEAYLRMIQSHCPAKQRLELKVGAQVILVKTTAALEGLVNGARGIITSFARETNRPVVKFADGIERVITNEVFSVSLGSVVVAQRSQLPLDLAWGISVHKSQGMTVDKAQLHLRNVFEYGQAYVALSRVRSVAGLSLSHPLQQVQVRAHPEVTKFYQRLRTATSVT